MRANRIAVAIVATLTLAAVSVSAQSSLPDDRTNAGPLGTVSMPREVDADASGAAAITANVSVNASLAADAGAEWILVSVGNDNATGLAVTLDEVRSANGDAVDAARTEGEGTTRAQWWLAVEDLSDTAELEVSASASTAQEITDVEVVIMAFDREYNMVTGDDGEPLAVQSFTTVHGSASGADDGNATDDGNVTDDGTTGGDGLDTGNGTDTGNGSSTDDSTQESGNDTPAPGLVLVLGVLGVAAVAASTRRR